MQVLGYMRFAAVEGSSIRSRSKPLSNGGEPRNEQSTDESSIN